MKESKVAVVAAVVFGLSYGGYLVTRVEPEAAVTKESAGQEEETDVGAVTRKDHSEGSDSNTGEREGRQRKRAQLLAAIETARKARVARAEMVASRDARKPTRSPASGPPDLSPWALDKDYLREQMGETLPLVRECFEETLVRRPDLEGTAVVEFSIVGEEVRASPHSTLAEQLASYAAWKRARSAIARRRPWPRA